MSTVYEMNDCEEQLQTILKTFKIKASVVNAVVGSRVTRYEVKLEPQQKLEPLLRLAGNIGLAFGKPAVRIEPVYGKEYIVGIEIPNEKAADVHFHDLLSCAKFQKSALKTTFIVGKNIDGKLILAEMEKMPHFLIAGTTGSGKSVCLNNIITSIEFYKLKKLFVNQV